MTNTIHGAFAPVPTAMTSEGNFDPEAFKKHLSWLGSEGLDGALILGTNGEFPSLSLMERRTVAEAAGAARGVLDLMLGVGSCALPETLEMAAAAADLGYDAVLCPPPFYFRAAPLTGIAAFFTELLDRSALPVLLYHIPQVTGVAISDELLDAIGRHENLQGVKDSTGSKDEMLRLIRRFSKGTYMVGNDHLVADCMEAGGTGSISAAASVAPALVARATRDSRCQGRLAEVRTLLEQYGLGPSVKAWLRAHGFGDYTTRPPLVGLSDSKARECVDKLDAALKTS